MFVEGSFHYMYVIRKSFNEIEYSTRSFIWQENLCKNFIISTADICSIFVHMLWSFAIFTTFRHPLATAELIFIRKTLNMFFVE